jgi:hypothetical protein
MKKQYLVIQHITLSPVLWVGVNYAPGGHATFFILALSFSGVIWAGHILTVLVFPQCKPHLTWWGAATNPLQVSNFIFV